jgi:hypothetical protein
METTTQQPEQKQTIDVTGLSAEAIRAVEALVSQLKGQQLPIAAPGEAQFSSHEEWSKAFRGWIASHKPLGTSADYSRESIYADDRDE